MINSVWPDLFSAVMTFARQITLPIILSGFTIEADGGYSPVKCRILNANLLI